MTRGPVKMLQNLHRKIQFIFVTFSLLLESYYSDMTDSELVEQVLNGNSNAFRYLVSKNQQLVVHIVGRMVRRQEDLEDICQEVFIKVYRKLGKFRGEAKLSTWIASIACNTCISHLRKKEWNTEIQEDAVGVKEEGIETPATLMEREEIKKYLMQMIEQLPVKYRIVLTLFHLQEFSYREIAEVTGMPEGTIKSYLSRARIVLKNEIERFSLKEKSNIFAEYAKR